MALAMAAFACLLDSPALHAQGPHGTRVVWVWKAQVDCPAPCPPKPGCRFEVRFAYNERKMPDGTIFIDAFDVEFRKIGDANCKAQFENGRGTFKWKCGENDCQLTPQNFRMCPCGTEIQFQDLDATDTESCSCPPAPGPGGVPGPPKCGDPITMVVQCPAGISSIEINATHDLVCSCSGNSNKGTLNWQVRFGLGRDGRKQPPDMNTNNKDQRPRQESPKPK